MVYMVLFMADKGLLGSVGIKLDLIKRPGQNFVFHFQMVTIETSWLLGSLGSPVNMHLCHWDLHGTLKKYKVLGVLMMKPI